MLTEITKYRYHECTYLKIFNSLYLNYKEEEKTYFKRNDNTNQHRWKSREIKVILKPVRSRENGQWWAQAPHPEWIHTVWKGSGQAKNKMFSEWQTNVRVCTGMRNRQRLKFCVRLGWIFNVLHSNGLLQQIHTGRLESVPHR